MDAVSRLQQIIESVPDQLGMVSSERAARPSAPGKWSPKQELGHLIDSAANNHQRIVRAQLENRPAMPGYDGDRWVDLHAYQNADWNGLIERWRAVNQQLLAAARAITPETAQRMLTVGGGEPITLQFLVEDYVAHLVHHLEHIGVPSFAAATVSD